MGDIAQPQVNDNLNHKSEMSLFTVSNTATTHPLKVRLSINRKPITMELDSGAVVSVISDEILHSCFPEAQVSKSDMVSKTYTGECMSVIGKWRVNVQYQDGKPQQLNLVVIKGNGPTLLGRNWLQCIHLDWPSIKVCLKSQTGTYQCCLITTRRYLLMS